MAKSKVVSKPIYTFKSNADAIRKAFRFFYNQKFFNKWMNKFDFPELNYQQKHFIMKKFWADGTISCASITTSNKSLAGLVQANLIDMKENSIVFAPWSHANRYNVYDFSTHARMINQRGVKFIPSRALEVDKEIVIGWAQKNHKSVFSSIEAKLDELVDIEMKKRVSRKSQSQPWLFVFTPEDYQTIQKMEEQIENDDAYLFVQSENADKVKSIVSGAPYIIDKLEQDRQKVENDILTILGVNNVGVGEKKEHLVVDEINANNQDIKENSDSYAREIKEFLGRINSVLGYKITLVNLSQTEETEDEEIEDDGGNKDGMDA